MITIADLDRFKLCKFDKYARDLIPEANVATLHRWVISGVRGGRVRLRAEKIGLAWHTCRAWVKEFIAAQNGGSDAQPEPAGSEASDAAGRQLERLGA